MTLPTLLIIILLLILIFGGGYGYRSGWHQSTPGLIGIIVIVLLVLILTGAFYRIPWRW